MSSAARRSYFPSLDALRTFACFFPLSTHLFWEVYGSIFLAEPALQGWPLDVLVFVFGNGTFGVRLFMAMSGFLITYLMLREAEATGTFSLRNFYMRRVLRIWPVYYAVIFYFYLVFPLIQRLFGAPEHAAERFWAMAVFGTNFEHIRVATTPGLVPNHQLSLIWSVAVEEQFYLVWPLLFLLGRSRGILWGGLLFGLASLVSQALLTSNWTIWTCHTLPCFLNIASGALMAWVYFHWPQRFERALQRIPYWACLALSLAGFFLLMEVGARAMELELWMPVFGLASALYCCWLMASQIAHQKHPWSAGKITWMVQCSKYTYGLYMYHRIVQWWVIHLALACGLGSLSPASLGLLNLLTLALSCVLARVSFRTFEAYFMKRKHLFASLPTRQAAPETAPTAANSAPPS